MLGPVEPLEATNQLPPEARPPRHRIFSVLTMLLVLVAFGIAMGSAVPAVARELGWTSVRTVARSSGKSVSHGNAGVEAVKERERTLQLGGLDDDDDDDAPAHGKTRLGITLHETKVYREPGEQVLASLDGGEKILVVKEDRGYFMVIHQGGDGADVGWVKRTDVMVR